jgi:hypothetical protein
MISFSWDDRKNEANKKKHGVSFDVDRFLMVGVSQKLRILIVCHRFMEEDSVIRIIAARKATKGKEDNYWRERK